MESLDALIFIDTNIFLDFYRIRKSNISMKYLEEIEKHKDIIITGSQVEMEFKKNRQAVILESIGEVKKISVPKTGIPAVLSDAQATKMVAKKTKEIESQQKKLKKQIDSILKEPKKNDPVFQFLQTLFEHKSEFNLDRKKNLRFTVRRLAQKRFMLGYPPRKKADNSIGDAVNWEWIIHCASQTKKHIIIVTRDSDFGKTYEGESYLDDWLSQEFKMRIGKRRKIILTEKLSKAFQLVKIPVTPEMIEEEEEVIEFSSAAYSKFLNASRILQAAQSKGIGNNSLWNTLYDLNHNASLSKYDNIVGKLNIKPDNDTNE